MATTNIVVSNTWYHNGGWITTGLSGNAMMAGWNHTGRYQTAACIAFSVSYSGVNSGQSIDFSMNITSYSTSTKNFKWILSTENTSRMLPSSSFATGTFSHGYNSGQSGSISFTASNLSLTSGATYYLYITGADGDSNSFMHITSVPAGVFTYTATTAVGRPTNVSLSTTSIYADGSVVVSWGAGATGINNAVAQYKIYAGDKEFSTTGTSYTIAATAVGKTKGSSFSISVQSIGSSTVVSNPSAVSAGTVYVVNKPPVAPSYSTSGIISAQKSSTSITVSSLSASDIDGDSITYYYKVSSSSTAPAASGATEISNNSEVDMSPTNKYLYIWSYDGSAYSTSPTRKTITVNTPPVINSITITPQKVNNQNILNYNDQIVTEKLSGSASISKTVSAYSWHITAGNGKQSLSSSSSFSNIDILSKSARESAITISLKVSDSVGDTDEMTLETGYYVMADILAPTFDSLVANETPKESENFKVASNYINEKMKAQITAPIVSGAVVPIKKMDIYFKSKNSGSVTLVDTYTPTSGAQATREFTYSSFSYDDSYSFFARLTDNANRIIDTYFENGMLFARLPLIPLGGEANSAIDKESLNIFTDTNVSFTTLYVDETNKGLTTYEVQGSINGKPYVSLFSFESTNENTTVTGNSIIYTVPDQATIYELYKKMGQPSSQNWPITYKIIAYNAFGVASTSYGEILNKQIITQTAPVLPDGALAVKIFYRTQDGGTEEAIQATNGYKSFNPGEVLQFSINEVAWDYNEQYFDGVNDIDKQDLQYYQIDYYINGEEVYDLDQISGWEKLTTFAPYADSTITNKLTQWDYIIPVINGYGPYIYFRIAAYDQSGTSSVNYLYCSSPLLVCRKVNPVFSISKIELSGDANDSFNLSYIIDDFGGDDKGVANFIRENSTEEITQFKIEYGPSLDTVYSTSVVTFQTKDVQNIDTTAFTIASEFANENPSKIFFKVSLIINTNSTGGIYNQVSTSLPAYIFYYAGPTLAHRSHWFGINTTDYKSDDEDDSFHVSSYDTRKYVSFSGVHETSGDQLVRLNLNTSHIFGLIANSGNWDNVAEEENPDIATLTLPVAEDYSF